MPIGSRLTVVGGAFFGGGGAGGERGVANCSFGQNGAFYGTFKPQLRS